MALSWPCKATASAVIILLVWQAYVLTGFTTEKLLSIAKYHHDASSSEFLYLHGDGDCAGIRVTTRIIRDASRMRNSCEHAPPPLQSFTSSPSRIATLSAFFTDSEGSNEHYRMALETHLLHTVVHRSSMHVLCRPIVDGMWNKQALILSILLQEMEKPIEERLGWIFWADGDTVVLDVCRNPLTFLQPPEARDNIGPDGSATDTKIDLLIAKDHNGINAGVFLARVNRWSVDFFSDVLAFRDFRPDVNLPFVEQSAMDNLLQENKYKKKVKYVPQHWFNAYGAKEGIAEEFLNLNDASELPEWAARKGDFLIHFAGCSNKAEEMRGYSKISRELENVWRSGDWLRDIGADIEAFWAKRDKTRYESSN